MPEQELAFSCYPYVNESSELKWPLNAQHALDMSKMSEKNHIYIYDIMKHCLGNFCIESPNKTWLLSEDVTIYKCTHSGDRFGRIAWQQFKVLTLSVPQEENQLLHNVGPG